MSKSLRMNRQDVKNVQGNESDKCLNNPSGYKLYPLGKEVGEGFRIGDMVKRGKIIGFLSNLDPNGKRGGKPFVFTTLDPLKIPKKHYSHGQFCHLSELELVEDDTVDDQEIADLFGIPVDEVPHAG